VTNSLLMRESQEKTLLLALQFLNHVGTLAGGVIALHYTIPAVVSLLHNRPEADPQLVLTAWGLVLALGSVAVPLSLLVRGFGAPSTLNKFHSTVDTMTFVLGVLILVAAQSQIIEFWLEAKIPSLGLIGATMLCVVTMFAFISGMSGGFHWISQVVRASFTALRVASRNRSQHRMLTGELLLCGGTARGVFKERNVAVGAPQRGEVLLYGEQSARRGTMAVGAPGSSKTRSKINPDLYWGLQSSPRAGALAFITKRRATQDCYAIAEVFRPKEKIHIVGVGADRAHMDITAGMTHESIGDAIQDGLGASHSDFWRHGPSAFVEGFIEIAKALAPATIHVPPELDDKGNVKPAGRHTNSKLPGPCRRSSNSSRSMDAGWMQSSAMALRASLNSKERKRSRRTPSKNYYTRSRSGFFLLCFATPNSARNCASRSSRSCSPSRAVRSVKPSAILTASILHCLRKGT